MFCVGAGDDASAAAILLERHPEFADRIVQFGDISTVFGNTIGLEDGGFIEWEFGKPVVLASITGPIR